MNNYNDNDELTRLIREMHAKYKSIGNFNIPLKKLYVGNLETGESFTINLENGEVNNDEHIGQKIKEECQ